MSTGLFFFLQLESDIEKLVRKGGRKMASNVVLLYAVGQLVAEKTLSLPFAERSSSSHFNAQDVWFWLR